jgi:excisionase family DNA binding protein
METEKKQILVRPAKAAQLLDMSKSKVYDAIHRREIPSILIAGQIRVPLAAIEQLIAERLECGADDPRDNR